MLMNDCGVFRKKLEQQGALLIITSSRVSLKDLAEAVGVSLATASQALNGKGRVSEATRERVKAAATKMGYSPHPSARATRAGRFNNIAMLLGSDLSGQSGPHTLQHGVLLGLKSRGLRLTLGHVSDDVHFSIQELPRMLMDWSSDGLLISAGKQPDEDLKKALQEAKAPVIWLNQKIASDCVYPDDIEAGYNATAHLLSLGHRRIAYVSHLPLSDCNHYSVSDRHEGYAKAMREAGLPEQVITPASKIHRKDLRTFLRDALTGPDRPTALVSYFADETVHALFLAAADLCLDIPSDLSLVAVGMIDTHVQGVTLTMVQVPLAEVGRMGVKLLTDKIENPNRTFAPKSVPPVLLPGDTARELK